MSASTFRDMGTMSVFWNAMILGPVVPQGAAGFGVKKVLQK